LRQSPCLRLPPEFGKPPLQKTPFRLLLRQRQSSSRMLRHRCRLPLQLQAQETMKPEQLTLSGFTPNSKPPLPE
jgi:hypothetical protein